MENLIKHKLSANFNSVRKAYLELDQQHNGFITAVNIAKFLGQSKNKNFDFTLLEVLVKMKSGNQSPHLQYSDFCRWLGPCIEPIEDFYFRHDSQKNP